MVKVFKLNSVKIFVSSLDRKGGNGYDHEGDLFCCN